MIPTDAAATDNTENQTVSEATIGETESRLSTSTGPNRSVSPLTMTCRSESRPASTCSVTRLVKRKGPHDERAAVRLLDDRLGVVQRVERIAQVGALDRPARTGGS